VLITSVGPAWVSNAEVFSPRRSSRCWIAVWAMSRPPTTVCRTPRPTPRKTVEIDVPVTSIVPMASISTVAIRAPTWPKRYSRPVSSP
jgi:hypothetical protein